MMLVVWIRWGILMAAGLSLILVGNKGASIGNPIWGFEWFTLAIEVCMVLGTLSILYGTIRMARGM